VRILTNALALVPAGSGVQRYVRELLGALPGVLPAGSSVAALVERRSLGLLPDGVEALPRRAPGPLRAAWSLVPPPHDHAADLVHGLDAEVPPRAGAPTVATVHDLSLFDVPWAFPMRIRLAKRAAVAASVRRADAVIVPSAFTADRLRSRFGRDCVIVHEAPGRAFAPPSGEAVASFRALRGLPDRFVLHVGNLEPRKDVGTLAAACRLAGLPLVLAGAHLRRTPAPPGAVDLGHVADGDLALLYGAATAVAYVSRYEGFGLPPVEAMAAGGVVVATRVGALPEIGGQAIEFVPAGDAERQAAVLAELAGDPERREERRRAGLAAAARLSWPDTAARTAAVYATLGVR
jgi:glycosyltransferase involved in cell wall biosynthesis